MVKGKTKGKTKQFKNYQKIHTKIKKIYLKLNDVLTERHII